MDYISENNLGGELNPIHNNIELTKAMIGRRNCYLYTVGTFEVNKENLHTLSISNIKLIGMAFAQAQYKPRRKKKQKTKPLNFIFDELHNLPLNISIGVDISLEEDKHVNYISSDMH